ncbi:hypothetical protein DL89DRAFT_16914 [Linderina pennispora]|uniref:Secreted protein n=1 Tax=Linderina pennispora TaxID=61395 RepID=A0A1Y1WMP4_9FUNG|nr:uncharacterized protein DL89DRAFT_16914 [Linderina pennispora]ORX74476.1 hypothetical protein DL89DRAFT_16914 [Linderina pennispora]
MPPLSSLFLLPLLRTPAIFFKTCIRFCFSQPASPTRVLQYLRSKASFPDTAATTLSVETAGCSLRFISFLRLAPFLSFHLLLPSSYDRLFSSIRNCLLITCSENRTVPRASDRVQFLPGLPPRSLAPPAPSETAAARRTIYTPGTDQSVSIR